MGDPPAINHDRQAEMLWLLAEQVLDYAVVLLDPEGRVLTWPPGAGRLFGHTPTDIVGRPFEVLFTPDDRAAGVPGRELAAARDTGRGGDDRWHVRADGSRFWVSGSVTPLRAGGALVGYAKIMRDRTDLHDARTFAEAVVATVREPLVVLDAALRVVSANPAYHAAFRTTPADAAGRFLYDLGAREWDVPALRRRLENLLPTDAALDGYEVEAEFPGRGRRVLVLNARKLERAGGRADLILLAVEDVTDRRAAEQTLRRVNDELEARVRDRTARLESANREMEAFCYSVSHDLRAPLRAIDGFARELLDAYADRVDETARHYLARMRANSQRMADLIDDLLQLSRLSRSEMAAGLVDLTALAGAVAAELRQREPGRRVDITIEPGLTARGDAGLLRVALENLLGNAWKFTAKKPAAVVTVGRTEGAGGPAYYVRDDGAGFDPRYAGKLFGAFQRLHHERDFPGTGIGLAIVQRVVHRHGGRVWAEGAVGAGATFYFTLPEGGGS